MQPSSPDASSSSISHQPSAPNYLSAKSADLILSEVRPTRMKSEALRSVNVLLDELLWLILGNARSFSTDQLRSGLLKVLPTVLGKSALLEAEVELRAYLDRNPPGTPVPVDETSRQRFPLQPAFELLRMKCEGYSSLGDQEEDAQAENALYQRMVQTAGEAATPKFQAIAPAALYLTAILEHICEHVLSNVGRVVARDSSRTTANSQDLYVALCEDETMYALFKTMKVQEQIEQQSRMLRSRRTKSASRIDVASDGIARALSPDTSGKSRPSLESAASTVNLPNRSSLEKARGKGLFRTGSNTEGKTQGHRRSSSLLGDKKAGTPVNDPRESLSPEDDIAQQDFDDLMNSGETMKVSLTPDRLKTFEVFAKEKSIRGSRPLRDTSNPPSSFTSSSPFHKASASKSRLRVESISEAPETDAARLRSASISSPTETKIERPSTGSRSRSFTDSRSSQNSSVSKTDPSTMPVPMHDPMARPRGVRRAPARNPEDLDLDDIMNVDDEDEPVVKKSNLTPKDAKFTSSGTQDLLDFLSEGPPEPVVPASPSVSSGVSDSRTAKQGRFRTIVSRLTGGSSTEKLSQRSLDEFNGAFHSGAGIVNGNSRSTPVPLHTKRSAPNVGGVVRPPRPPQPPPVVPTPTSHSQESTPPSSSGRSRHMSMTTRKAVPVWEGDQSKPVPPPAHSAKLVDPIQVDLTNTTKHYPPRQSSMATDSAPTEVVSPISPSRKRVPPPSAYDVPVNGTSVHTSSKPSSPISPITNGRAVNGHASHTPTSPVSRKTGNRDGPKVEKTEQLETQALPQLPPASPVATITVPTHEYVADFRRLMDRATTADECRVLMEMFLARCGCKKEGDKDSSKPASPPVVDFAMDEKQELQLVAALLGGEVEVEELASSDSEVSEQNDLSLTQEVAQGETVSA